jgi:hypothetical protein
MIDALIIAAAVHNLAPYLPNQRIMEIARPIAAAARTIDEGVRLTVVNFRESSFLKKYETCEELGDKGAAYTSYQLHVRHWFRYGSERVCSDPRLAAWITVCAMGDGTTAEQFARHMGRKPNDREVLKRVAFYEEIMSNITTE